MSFIFYAYAIEDGGSPEVPTPFVRFVGTPEEALGFFFSKGFHFAYDDAIWTDTTSPNLYQEFEADGYDIPNSMEVALRAGNPNINIIVDDRLIELVGIRRIAKKGGKRGATRHSTRRRRSNRSRSTYRSRK